LPLLDLLAELDTADDGSLMRRILAHGLQALIEAEATSKIGAGRHEQTPGPDHPAQRQPGQDGDHDRRGRHGGDPEDPDRQLLPVAAGAAAQDRPAAARGDLRGLRARRLDP